MTNPLASLFGGAPAAAPAAPAPAPAVAPAVAPAAFDWMSAVVSAEVVNRGSSYMPAGLVVGTIDQFKLINKDDGGQGIALEFTIVESATPALQVGTAWCLYRDVPGKKKMGAADVKTWICAVLNGIAVERGMQPPEFSRELLGQIVSDAQPLKGLRIKIQGTDVPKKDGTGNFTRYSIEYVPTTVERVLG